MVDNNNPDINPVLSSADACEDEGLSDGAETVVLVGDGVVPFEEFEAAIPVKACKTPKYAGFLETVASMMSPEPVPGNVDSIQEYFAFVSFVQNRIENTDLVIKVPNSQTNAVLRCETRRGRGLIIRLLLS